MKYILVENHFFNPRSMTKISIYSETLQHKVNEEIFKCYLNRPF